jgi:glyoxylase-like metal-dependent hydrolase (beta-lactamase superfamily II)
MSPDRRGFLTGALSCAGWLLTGLALAPVAVRRSFAARPRKRVVAETRFARIERIAKDVWAVVSTPFGEGGPYLETVANGGVVAGRDGVLVIEGFYREAGAAWLAGRVRELTGREPTHVVVTHHHADHVHGIGGLGSGRPEGAGDLRMLTTPTTRELLVDAEQAVLPDAGIPESGERRQIDLGGRVATLTVRKGHTPSDVTVELAEPRVVFCGDLVWNGMFPNYVDAIPSQLTRHCESLLDRRGTTFVPGHGELGDAEALAPYRALLLDIEAAARRAFEKGTPTAEAAGEYRLPQSLEHWTLFADDLFERAFHAWERELLARETVG